MITKTKRKRKNKQNHNNTTTTTFTLLFSVCSVFYWTYTEPKVFRTLILHFWRDLMVLSSDIEKEMLNIRKFSELPKVSMTFLDRIRYFLFPMAKQRHLSAERYNKNVKRLQNQRYYAKHRDEIRTKRRERYEYTGQWLKEKTFKQPFSICYYWNGCQHVSTSRWCRAVPHSFTFPFLISYPSLGKKR